MGGARSTANTEIGNVMAAPQTVFGKNSQIGQVAGAMSDAAQNPGGEIPDVQKWWNTVQGNNTAGPGSGAPLPTLGDVAGQPSPFANWETGGTLDPNATMTPDLLSSDFLGKNGMAGGGAVDTTAMKGLQGYAVNSDGTLNTSASPWLNMENANIDLATGQARNQAAHDAQTASDSAMSNAAMHGGVTGGGSARIAALGETGAATGEQNATLAGNMAKNNAAATDWQNKLSIASALPGMQQALAQYNTGNQEFNANTTNSANAMNIGNLISGIQGGNSNLLAQYAQSIAGQGGQEMAAAMRASGKKK